jgi:Zn-dependent protease with chaperone function
MDPQKRFEESSLPKKEVTYREFMNTINLASMMMKNYRGKILFYDMLGWGTILFGLLIIILLGIGTSSSTSGNWGNMVLYILLYFIIVPIIYKVSKCFQCKYLRQAHFVLGVVCRAENNRYYLKKGVEVRPGYLARWIEFSVIDQTGPRDIVSILRERHDTVIKQT